MVSDKEKIEKEKKIDFGLVEIFDRYELWEDENAEEIMDELEDLLQSQKEEWVEEIREEIIKEIENKLGNKQLEDLKWAVNPILGWVLRMPPKEIDEESVYELAGEIFSNLKQEIKTLK
jgi:hypothetical protein